MIWTDIYIDEKFQLNFLLESIAISFNFLVNEMVMIKMEEDILLHSDMKIIFLLYKSEDYINFNQISIYLGEEIYGSIDNLIFAAKRSKVSLFIPDDDDISYEAFVKIDENGIVSKIKIALSQ